MEHVSGVATTPYPNGPVMSQPENVKVAKASHQEYEESLKIVLGTVFGVFGVVGIIIIVVLLYRYYKSRGQRRRSGSSDRNTSLHRSVSIDLEHKQMPTVLILHSYDCSAHEKVIESLAGFLIETCSCNVHVDLFEEQVIHERGLDDWLVDNLQEAEFIIVICSVGARLRCSKKKVKFKQDPAKTLPDYFAVAVDYVAEKIRVERSKGMPLTSFCALYMDYSTVNDIPPQLEMAYKFCLMKDITELFCHLHGINGQPTKDGSPILGLTPDTFDTTEMGQELKVAIESAKEFFRANPDWVEGRMEPMPMPVKSKSRHHRKRSDEPLLLAQHLESPNPQPTSHIHPSEISVQPLPIHSPHSKDFSLTCSTKKKYCYHSGNTSNNALLPPPIQHNSKSCDNVPCESVMHCDLCGLEGHEIGSPQCRLKHFILSQEIDSVDNDDSIKLKSKSMPAVNRNSLYSSQTIFKADVHKEWDDNDGSLSHADSQDSDSNADSSVDDLEKDLESIVNPSFAHKQRTSYSHSSFDNIAKVNNVLQLPRMENISETGNKRMPSNKCHDLLSAWGQYQIEAFSQSSEGKDRNFDHIQLEEFTLRL
ncbi:interleukin-17 receptor D-like isoform X2 [Dreissena polymorpha]|uniref:interleukin-17 receptor D-like isoform X2 n=1 Tax=Dreissena polymorpha TaxID=45954 RepID=UPI002264156A|nr:interleukin-17 receptor D-like isoform X2 [Dreissena polymorpha]